MIPTRRSAILLIVLAAATAVLLAGLALPAGGHAVGHRQAKEPTRARVMTSFDPLPEDPAFGVGQVPIHALGGGRDPTLDHQIG